MKNIQAHQSLGCPFGGHCAVQQGSVVCAEGVEETLRGRGVTVLVGLRQPASVMISHAKWIPLALDGERGTMPRSRYRDGDHIVGRTVHLRRRCLRKQSDRARVQALPPVRPIAVAISQRPLATPPLPRPRGTYHGDQHLLAASRLQLYLVDHRVPRTQRRPPYPDSAQHCPFLTWEFDLKQSSGYSFELSKNSRIGMVESVNAAKGQIITPVIPDVRKPHPGQIASAANIFELLAGSSLTVSDSDLTAPSVPDGHVYLELESRIQDPYSIRCAPHVVGVLRDTMTWAEQWLTHEINSSNGNPLFHVEVDVVSNNGNFYGGHVAHAAQAPTLAVASMAERSSTSDEKRPAGIL